MGEGRKRERIRIARWKGTRALWQSVVAADGHRYGRVFLNGRYRVVREGDEGVWRVVQPHEVLDALAARVDPW